MTKAEFDAFVRRQQVNRDGEAKFDAERQLKEWLDHLDALYQMITSFLGKYLTNGSAQLTTREIRLNEEFSGPYNAKEFVLQIGRSTVMFTPIGTMLIGSKGRVDVQGPLGSVRLVLVNKNVTTARQLVQVTIAVPGKSPPTPPPPTPDQIKSIEWAWKIVSRPPDMRFIELTESTFYDMILSVADA